MRTVFESWKYLFKNILFLLPFSLVPAVFLSLSLDYNCIHTVWYGFFTGEPRAEFLEYLHAWSFLRIDDWLGALYSLIAIVATIFAFSVLLCFVEKHMRLGKRTLSGLWQQTKNILPSVAVYTLLMVVFYEIWAIVLSAVLFAIASISATPAVYVLSLIAMLAFGFVLIYLMTILYLWLPCKQMTGFRFFEAFLYSYRLMVRVRGKLLLSFAISAVGKFLILVLCALLPYAAYHIIAVILFLFLFLNFGIRMETLYFETDKLDREDILRHKWEY